MEAKNNKNPKSARNMAVILAVLIMAAVSAGYFINKNIQINNALAAALAKSDGQAEGAGGTIQTGGFLITGVLSPIYTYNVSARAGGQVEEICIVKGQKVKIGDILLRQNAKDVQLSAGQGSTTDELLQRLKVAYDSAEDTYKRNKALYDAGFISESSLKQLEAQKENARLQYEGTSKAISQQTAKTVITSPGNGVVSGLSIQQGEYLNAGTAIASISDTSKLILKGNVIDSKLQKISKGDKVQVKIDTLNKTLEGEVTFVSPISVASGQMFPIEITLDNSMEEIKAGMSASVKLN
ncbi:MAG: efflux RND transporter periplasmic adaptor subunit [Clostridiaceae bacterium]